VYAVAYAVEYMPEFPAMTFVEFFEGRKEKRKKEKI
jgi:uncharacterized short protein YbdD (DUF466 family)